MHVIEHLAKAKNPLFSYEIVPPPRGTSVQTIINIVEALQPLAPPWIDVTSHSSTSYLRERSDGALERKTFRKRPGTLGICGIIQNRFKIDTVAHMLCLGFTREETEDALLELNFLGIQNVLALRGDTPNFQKVIPKERSSNLFAADLVGQIKELNSGHYLEDLDSTAPLNFCIGVSGYPEKHFEAPSLKVDIQKLKDKIDRGAHYVVTQMFFDNKKFMDFHRQCREAGITVPIIPGLKILKSAAQLRTLPKTFHIDLPDELVGQILESPDHASEIGERWAHRQAEELLNFGCQSLHYYILNDSEQVLRTVSKLRK